MCTVYMHTSQILNTYPQLESLPTFCFGVVRGEEQIHTYQVRIWQHFIFKDIASHNYRQKKMLFSRH